MDIFSQNRFLKRIVWVLAIANIILIGSFWFMYFKGFSDRKPKNSPSSKELSIVLKKELDLSLSQMEQLKEIRFDFLSKEKIVREQIRLERDSMNMLMFAANDNSSRLKELATRVSEGEYQMELLRIDQSIRIREICTSEQLMKFEGLVKEIRDYLKPEDANINAKPEKIK
jgi:Spy/CpxP family protein refolding chaperone